jgi:hypothetical protein
MMAPMKFTHAVRYDAPLAEVKVLPDTDLPSFARTFAGER